MGHDMVRQLNRLKHVNKKRQALEELQANSKAAKTGEAKSDEAKTVETDEAKAESKPDGANTDEAAAPSAAGPLKDLDEWQDEKADKYQNETGKAAEEFRNYKDGERQARVLKFYTEQHLNQTFDSVTAFREKYLKFDHDEMGIWETLEVLDSLVDESDPDTDVSQLQHALMTAEAIRKKFPDEKYEWFWVTGLIHDLGKILSLKYAEPQWAVVGDSFPVGCKFSQDCVIPESFEQNPDSKHAVYSTEQGIYKPGQGLSTITMSWGHDEYLYQVCKHNKCTLPTEGLYMIRFHSFYPWHNEGAYKWLEDKTDKEMLKWVKEFNQFDLYSKGDELKEVEKLKTFYKEAILRYFPAQCKW